MSIFGDHLRFTIYRQLLSRLKKKSLSYCMYCLFIIIIIIEKKALSYACIVQLLLLLLLPTIAFIDHQCTYLICDAMGIFSLRKNTTPHKLLVHYA